MDFKLRSSATAKKTERQLYMLHSAKRILVRRNYTRKVH